MRFLIPFAIAFFASPLFACIHDTDCGIGSQCVKSKSSIYGVCMGGMNPGNRYDRQPTYDPLDATGTRGKSCSYDTECGPGLKCVMGSSIQGTCM
jgi:hypothetical protein